MKTASACTERLESRLLFAAGDLAPPSAAATGSRQSTRPTRSTRPTAERNLPSMTSQRTTNQLSRRTLTGLGLQPFLNGDAATNHHRDNEDGENGLLHGLACFFEVSELNENATITDCHRPTKCAGRRSRNARNPSSVSALPVIRRRASSNS